MQLSRLAPVVLSALTLAVPAAHADVPDIPDAAFQAACDEARALDACPTCGCSMITSTSPSPAAASSPVPLGVILEVRGEIDELPYTAIHAALGDKDKLEHLGRLAEARQGGPSTTSYEITALPQAHQGCTGDCPVETVGLIHPFRLERVELGFNPDLMAEERWVDTELVLCFEGLGGNMCVLTPIASETTRTPISDDPGKRPKKAKKEGFKRTWKLGKAGDIVFGAATGKQAKKLSAPKAHKVSLVELAGEADARAPTR
ncbi:MAG: hypothetical protein EP329_26005 [Deltaproteobacteria bacterium]|nr:MAG: hypothetical protein EP329_26005 [Deltaproteobacteria bacterium]